MSILWKLNPVNNTDFSGHPYVKGLRVDSIPPLLGSLSPPLVGNTIIIQGNEQLRQVGVKKIFPLTVTVVSLLLPIRGGRVSWSKKTGFVPCAGDVGMTFPRLELGYKTGDEMEYVAISQGLTHAMVFNKFERDMYGNPHPIGMYKLRPFVRTMLRWLVWLEEE